MVVVAAVVDVEFEEGEEAAVDVVVGGFVVVDPEPAGAIRATSTIIGKISNLLVALVPLQVKETISVPGYKRNSNAVKFDFQLCISCEVNSSSYFVPCALFAPR